VTATTAANLSGAVLTYSTDKASLDSYPSAGISVTRSSEILYVKDSLGGISQVDSAIYPVRARDHAPSGGYTAAQTVSIKDSGATIKYYLGPRNPPRWTSYTGPLSINTCTVLHSSGRTLGSATSNTVAATYAFPPSISPSFRHLYRQEKRFGDSAVGADSLTGFHVTGANWTSGFESIRRDKKWHLLLPKRDQRELLHNCYRDIHDHP
jgi:hypothetical protein